MESNNKIVIKKTVIILANKLKFQFRGNESIWNDAHYGKTINKFNNPVKTVKQHHGQRLDTCLLYWLV